MELLTVAAPLDGLHHQILRGHEGQIFPDGPLYDLFVHMESVGDVLGKAQNGIGAEEALRQTDPPVGGVVQGPLQPLGGGGHGGIQGIRHQIPGQGADALAAHGIALVGHSGGTDLILFEGLFHLPVMLQQADVVCHPVAALGDGGQNIQDPAVQLPGIGLAADGKALVKAKVPGDHFVHLVDLGAVSVEEVHEAGLGAGGAPAAQEAHIFDDEVQLLYVAEQVLHPQSGTLAHGDQLSGLIVGVAQGGHILVGVGKLPQIGQHLQKLCPQVFQAVPIDHNVGVVGDVAGGSTQVDDAGGRGSHLAVGIDMGHDIMAHQLLPLGGHGVVDVGNVGLQLPDLLLGDVQAQLVLGLGQGNPQLPPGLVAHILGEKVEHILRSVAAGQGGFVAVCHNVLLSGR